MCASDDRKLKTLPRSYQHLEKKGKNASAKFDPEAKTFMQVLLYQYIEQVSVARDMATVWINSVVWNYVLPRFPDLRADFWMRDLSGKYAALYYEVSTPYILIQRFLTVLPFQHALRRSFPTGKTHHQKAEKDVKPDDGTKAAQGAAKKLASEYVAPQKGVDIFGSERKAYILQEVRKADPTVTYRLPEEGPDPEQDLAAGFDPDSPEHVKFPLNPWKLKRDELWSELPEGERAEFERRAADNKWTLADPEFRQVWHAPVHQAILTPLAGGKSPRRSARTLPTGSSGLVTSLACISSVFWAPCRLWAPPSHSEYKFTGRLRMLTTECSFEEGPHFVANSYLHKSLITRQAMHAFHDHYKHLATGTKDGPPLPIIGADQYQGPVQPIFEQDMPARVPLEPLVVPPGAHLKEKQAALAAFVRNNLGKLLNLPWI